MLIMSPAHAHMHACTHGFGTCSNSGETIFAIIGWQPSTAMHGQEGAQSLLATCNTCTPGLSLFSYACCAHLCLPCVWARITCAANPHARIFLQNNSCLLPWHVLLWSGYVCVVFQHIELLSCYSYKKITELALLGSNCNVRGVRGHAQLRS